MAALLDIADLHRAHARMLEERPTGVEGEVLDLPLSLGLLQTGQLVNCAIGPNARPGRHSVPDAASSPDAAVAAKLLLSSSPRKGVEITAAEVLVVNAQRAEVILGSDSLTDTIVSGLPAVIDFTDATGTYYLAGVVKSAHSAPRPNLVVRIRQATLVQLRRFVRVPVLITPYTLEVQLTPGAWLPVRGEIVDISLGGLGLLVDTPLLGDVHARVEFELPGRFGDLLVRGRVVTPPGPAEAQTGVRKQGYTQRSRQGAFLAHRRGIALDPLTLDDLRRLQRSLYHRQVELRRVTEQFHLRQPQGTQTAVSPPPSDADDAERRPRWKFWGGR
jgi:hypothetical protein